MSVANSPLVKTAMPARTANWARRDGSRQGRRAANRDKLSISFNGIRVASRGARDPSYDERKFRRR